MPEDYQKQPDYYFDSYSHFSIHEEMLKDKTRTLAYKQAILNNKELFQDKIVLDLGCGTGILSMFCAQAGAKHVYAIEYAAIAQQAQQIVELNGFQKTITVIRGKVEEINLPVEQVDIIVSEWMGYFLLYESMFDSVLFAKNKWLKKGGMLFPDKAQIFVAALEDQEYKEMKINFWDDVWGFKMSNIKQTAIMEPLIDIIESENIISEKCCILDIDLENITQQQLDFVAKYNLKILKKNSCHAIVAWFDCWFTHGQNQVLLSTSPYTKYTHWKQVVFYLDQNIKCDLNDNLEGTIGVKKNQINPRELDVKISCYHKEKQIQNQFYKIS